MDFEQGIVMLMDCFLNGNPNKALVSTDFKITLNVICITNFNLSYSFRLNVENEGKGFMIVMFDTEPSFTSRIPCITKETYDEFFDRMKKEYSFHETKWKLLG